MPYQIIPVVSTLGGTAITTAVSEKLNTPGAIVSFYVAAAKSCYKATGSKRITCLFAAGTCGLALVPGPHQNPFIVACATSLRGLNKF
jgi:hypothetical protein